VKRVPRFYDFKSPLTQAIGTMSLTISQAARAVGLRPSAIRYYEQIGILRPAARVRGQRRYDDAALYRLAVIQRSRQLGFTLPEIRTLFFAFKEEVPAAPRWRELSERKLEELDRLVEGVSHLQALLRAQGTCGCGSLEDCGRWLVEQGSRGPSLDHLAPSVTKRR
jgi:MerR family redox-sensitive transcriptional activator SoxR